MIEKLKSFLENKIFINFIIVLILLNWVSMWLETSKYIMENYSIFINTFDKLVVAIFTIEVSLKIIAYKKDFFKSWWNIFDFIIVIISLIPTSWPLQILRVLRVLRLLRLITFIPQMKRVVTALFEVIPGILSIASLLMLIFYIFAIMTTNLYSESFPEWFWDLWKSFYTLFQIMTLESWSMWIVRPIMEVHPYSWIVFIIFILIATFIMVNLVIAIVVEAMNKINKQEEKSIVWKNTIDKTPTKSDFDRLEKKIDNLQKSIILNSKFNIK